MAKSKQISKDLVIHLVIVSLLTLGHGSVTSAKAMPQAETINDAIVFVSREIPSNGSLYMAPEKTGSLPGVAPYSRFQSAKPGKLILLEPNGTLRTLIDGANPTVATLNLVDVNAPDVSYDATKIIFAGLTVGTYSTAPLTNPGGWRIYVINVDGTGLRQVTFSDRENLDMSQLGEVASKFLKYDDTDPAWLPDGRIVFSSTRWPEFGQYGAAHATNLYVINENGTGLHRITSERNGADRPIVDPLTGKIVYSRWWRNFRIATNSMQTISDPQGGYIMKDGLLSIVHSQPPPNENEVGGFHNLDRNSWHLAAINPDGTELVQWGGRSNTYFLGQISNHAYGGSFAPDGSFYANFFPMNNMTEAAGFGGIRRYQRGPNDYMPIIGVTVRDDSNQPLVSYNPPSHGVYKSNYAAEPEVLPDGRLIISWAQDIKQDYGLYIINGDGSNLTLLYDNPDTTELRARLVRPRPVPPIIPDKVTQIASPLPPKADGPYDKDGTFTFQALNVYFNAPVDTNIVSAMPVGSANTIRFFIDHQRWQQTGSHESLDWPILLDELPVNPDGSVTATSPANVPLFEQIRTYGASYNVPLTGRGAIQELGGAAHVAGMNFGRPGDVVRCVGCHAGHTMIQVPENSDDAKWTNLAPGAEVSVSSLNSTLPNSDGLVDRRNKIDVPSNNNLKYWISKTGVPDSQWIKLTFPVPVTVRTVRLYNIPSIDSSIKVMGTRVSLYSDASGTIQVATNTSGPLSENGTNVAFNDISARVVYIEFTSVIGSAAGLGEVEVIARGEEINTNPSLGDSNHIFSDVSPSHPYFSEIEALYNNGLTNGCSTTQLMFCPAMIMNRAQVAKFFMAVQYGGSYLPPTDTPILFMDDWRVNPWAELWANDMYAKGLTSGCSASPLRYCPDNQVIREQVAKFALAIKYGNSYEPPPATGMVFADLADPDYWATAWAEQAYAEGLIPACGTDSSTGKPLICPFAKVNRGFAAFVIVNATGLLDP